MATPSEIMNNLLHTISVAVKGKDMRSAIHDGIEKAYNDSYNWYDSSLSKCNKAEADAASAKATAEGLSTQIAAVQDLGEDFEELYDETTERIDNIIAHNNDTEHNTELIDIRTTYNGYTALAAGTAVRKQARDLNNRMDQIVRTFPTREIPLNISAVSTRTELWSNPNPSNPISAFSIPFNATVMETALNLIIEFKYHKNSATKAVVSVPLPESGFVDESLQNHEVDSNNRLVVLKRNFGVSRTGLTVSDAYYIYDSVFSLSGNALSITDPNAVQNTDNDFFIPTKIWAEAVTISSTVAVAKDSEITDARVGVDGTVYNSLGEAIRGQISQYMASGIIDALNDDY